MSRPSNEDLYNKTPELATGSESAVNGALALYATQTDVKALESKIDPVTGDTTVTVGYKDVEGTYHIVEATVDINGAARPGDERKDEHPGKGHDKDDHGHSADHKKHR